MRRLVAALALLVVAAAATGISGAAMTAGRDEAPSVFAGGTLDLAVEGAGAASLLDATAMRPGQVRSAIVGLRDAGSVPATLSVDIEDRTDVPEAAALSAVLELRIEDCGADAGCAAPHELYAGSLKAFAGAAIGDVAAGAVRHVRVSLLWDAGKADPARQGARTDATLIWQAVAGSAA